MSDTTQTNETTQADTTPNQLPAIPFWIFGVMTFMVTYMLIHFNLTRG